MDLIKKQILLISGTTGTTNFNILLTADIKDMGFYDTSDDYVRSTYSGYTSTPEYALLTTSYTVTGFCSTRLGELEKYVVSTNPAIKYFGGGSVTVNGLSSFSITPASTAYTYFLGGIRYVDLTLSGDTGTTTSFSFTNAGLSPNNFDNKFVVKFESKQNMVENRQVSSDVFIIRQQQPVFEKNYRLRGINSLNNALTYAGGNYFEIFNNT